jgi:hypothetical protein
LATELQNFKILLTSSKNFLSSCLIGSSNFCWLRVAPNPPKLAVWLFDVPKVWVNCVVLGSVELSAYALAYCSNSSWLNPKISCASFKIPLYCSKSPQLYLLTPGSGIRSFRSGFLAHHLQAVFFTKKIFVGKDVFDEFGNFQEQIT